MTAATAPTNEIGYVNQSHGSSTNNWWMYEDETTPELRWPQSVRVYDQMRTQDAQVGSVLEAVVRPILRTTWRLDPAGARPEVVEQCADDLGLPIVGENPSPPPRTKGRFSWLEHLELALLMLPYGHMFFEQTYEINEDGTRAHLGKLSPRMPKTIDKIDVARDGGLISITQCGTLDYGTQKPIPVNRLVAYVYKKEGGNWLGRSILRQAYKNSLLKDRLLRVQAQTIERNGMGIPLYTAQEGASPADMAAGLAMAKGWRSGESAGTAIPFGASLSLVGVSGTLPDAQPAIDYHDNQIARAVLAHFLNLGQQSGTGSYALGVTFADFFTASLQTLAQQIADVATQHIVEDLVDVNWGPTEPAPKITFDEIGSRQQATAQALVALMGAGALTPDDRLEQSLRQQYGLPPKQTQFLVDQPGDGPPPPPDVEAIEVQASKVAASQPHPGQRFRHGWIPIGGEGDAPAALKDSLKLAGKIDLDAGEEFVGSDKIQSEHATVRAAVTERGGRRSIRLGLGDGIFGSREDEGGPWRGRDTAAEENARRAPLAAEFLALQNGLGDMTPAEQSRFDALDEMALNDVVPSGHTARLDENAAARLRTALATDLDKALQVKATEDARFAEIDRLEAQREPLRNMQRKWTDAEDAQWDDLTAKIEALEAADPYPNLEDLPSFEGSVPAEWADVHYRIEYYDGEVGATIGAVPHDSGRDFADLSGNDETASLDPAEIQKLIALLGSVAPRAVQASVADEGTVALIAALADFTGEIWAEADFDESKHLRGPGGKFRNMFGRIQRALADWSNGDGAHDPLAEFKDRAPLMDAAKKRGVPLKRGASRDEIVRALLDDIRDKRAAARGEEAPPKPSHRLTLSSPRYRDQDVGVYAEKDGKVSLYREASPFHRGSKVVTVDSLADLEQWGRDNDEPQVAKWAASERDGGKPVVKKAAPRKAAKKAAPASKDLVPAGKVDHDSGPLSEGELVALQLLSAQGWFKDGGWVSSDAVTSMHRQHLETLHEKGWIEKHVANGETTYRINPMSAGTQKAAKNPDAALVGDVIPAVREPDARLSLSKVHFGAILEGYRSPSDDLSFGNMLEDGEPDESRVMRVRVQRIERVDENGEPTTALLTPYRRIIGHDTRTGRRVQSGPVPAGSYWSWVANPEEDVSPDIEGEIVPERAPLSAVDSDGKPIPVPSKEDRDRALLGDAEYERRKAAKKAPAKAPGRKVAPKKAAKKLADVQTGDVVLWHDSFDGTTLLGRVSREPGKGTFVDWSGGRRERLNTRRAGDVRVATDAEVAEHGPIAPVVDAPSTPRKAPAKRVPATPAPAKAVPDGDAVLSATDVPTRSLSSDEVQSLGGYGLESHHNINGGLREGAGSTAGLRAKHQAMVADIDGIMARSPLRQDVVVYRGLSEKDLGGNAFPIEGDLLDPDTDWTGRSWTDHGYSSTSATQEGAKSRTSRLMLRITAPAGTPAISNSELDPGEILLGRGLTFRVVKDRGISGGQRHLDVEIAPPDPLADLRTMDTESARDALDLRKVPELKAMLKAEGLPVSGNKRALVDRLVEHLGGGGKPSTPRITSLDESVPLSGDPQGDNMRMHGDSVTMGLAQAYARAGRNGSANRMMDLRRRATTNGSDGIHPQQVVDELRAIRTQETDPKFQRQLDDAIDAIDAPMTPMPELPPNTPPLARQLIEDLHAIPYARKQNGDRTSAGYFRGQSLIDQLAAAYWDMSRGERPRRGQRPEDRVRDIARGQTHESNEASFRLWELARRLESDEPGTVDAGRKRSALTDELNAWEQGKLPVGGADPKVDGSGWRGSITEALTGQAALDATPTEYRSGPRAHHGDYEGATFTVPAGAGDEQALAEYEGVEYERTNSYLRHGPMADSPNMVGHVTDLVREMDATTAARIAEIDQTMSVSPLADAVEVTRAIKDGRATFGPAWHEGVINDATTDFDEQDREYERWLAGDRPDLTGLTWHELAYVSTSVSDEHSQAFGERWSRMAREMPDSSGEPVIMTIRVPAGTQAIQLGQLGFTEGPGDRQIMGSAELMLQRGLTMTVVADHGVDENGFRRLDVEVVPDA